MQKTSRSERAELLCRQSLIAVITLLAVACYWWVLIGHLQDKRNDLIEQAHLRAGQIAASVATQTKNLFSDLNILANQLATLYANQDPTVFDSVVQSIQRSYPTGAIDQMLLADANGDVVYASSNDAGQPLARTGANIAGWEYFYAHRNAAFSSLFISQPETSTSGQWIIRLSRPMRANGVLTGVLVISINASYLSAQLGNVLPNVNDVVMLLHGSDGTYLARSRDKEKLLGRPLPPNREFLHDFSIRKGTYTVHSPMDGIKRLYTWQRVTRFPLVINVGLDLEALQAPLQQEIHTILTRNRLLSAVVLIGMLIVQWLSWRHWHATCQVRRSEERLRQTMAAVNDGMWEWDLVGGTVTINRRCGDILGYDVDQMRMHAVQILRLTHPSDRGKLRRRLVGRTGQDGVFRLAFRLRRADSRWIWVEARGNVIAASDGPPTHMLGTLSDIDTRMLQTSLRRVLLDESAAAVILASTSRQITYANRCAHSMFARHGASLTKQSLRVIHKDDESFAHFGRYYDELIKQGRLHKEFELRFADGSERWCDMRGTLLDISNLDSQVIWTIMDNDDSYRAREALYVAQQRLSSIIERFPGYVLVQEPAGPIAAINPAFAELLRQPGPTGQEASPNLLDRLYALLPKETRSRVAQEADGDLSCEFNLPDGRYFKLHRIRLRAGSQPLGLFWMARDITVTKHREMTLMQQAQTDPLTKLPNRRALMERMQHTLHAIHGGKQSAGAVMIIDIDFFKTVNDTWGHAVGDVVLCHLSALLRNTFHRASDLAGRLGGEEFVVLLPQTGLKDAQRLAEKLRVTVADNPTMTPSGPVPITISIGLSALHVHQVDIQDALTQADEALYHAKHTGRNRTAVWSAEMKLPASS